MTSHVPPTIGNPTGDPSWFDSREPQILGASITLLVLPTVAVLLRLLSRWLSGAGYWLDDYTVVLAMVFSWGPNVVNIVGTHHGFGQHITTLPDVNQSLLEFFKYLYAFEFLYTLGMATIKYSVLCFLHRIFPIVQFRRLLKAILAFLIALTIASVIVSMFQCVPIHAFWDSLAGYTAHAQGYQCINVQNYFLAAGAIGTFIDFVLLALPIPILWRLRTGVPQKLLLTGIFIVGCTVCAVSVVRLVVLSKVGQPSYDITWSYVPESLWTAAEPSTAVVCACLPSLRPLFVRMLWGDQRLQKISRLNRKLMTNSWWSGKSQDYTENSLNQLQESPSNHKPWPWRANSVTVLGGRDIGNDEYELGATKPETPTNRIRAETTVVWTVSERVDWRDDLF